MTAPPTTTSSRPVGTIFVQASARNSPRGPWGPSKSLAPFRVRRRPHSLPPPPLPPGPALHQDYSTPVSAPLRPLAPSPAGTIFGLPSQGKWCQKKKKGMKRNPQKSKLMFSLTRSTKWLSKWKDSITRWKK